MKTINNLKSDCPALDALGKKVGRYSASNYAAEAWEEMLTLPQGECEVLECGTSEWTTTTDAQGNKLPAAEAAGFAFAAFKSGNKIFRGELSTMMRGCDKCPKIMGEFWNWWNGNKGEKFTFVGAEEIPRTTGNGGVRKKISWTF